MSKSGKLTCPKTNNPCEGSCAKETKAKNPLGLTKTIGGDWLEPATLSDLLTAVASAPADYRLVCGNTGKGAFTFLLLSIA